ncbi:putative pentatricopeptide repeat-containing protein [Hibiscus syriacus]|uniref:Pentatricopeptide repeat-containing protein n=1 Tax=Hibiscus syriacus TaxID=106335 RepID=A0A6A2WE41_HIBSY|nr:putative pentatricopeptide repeat-containing protein [Hibiscus syriacus]
MRMDSSLGSQVAVLLCFLLLGSPDGNAALSAGIPFLQPYLNSEALFSRGRGVNFAVAGSTALPVEILAENGIVAPVTNTSLSRQLDWMFTHFNGICRDDEDCYQKLKTALFIVGEIGGNDYSYALFQGKSFDQVKSMAPSVVQAIKDAVARVVGYGATRVIIPGNFPIGCLPIHLRGIEKELPNAIIVYADYYNAYMKLLNKAAFLGFDPHTTDKACCGYNLGSNKMCGAPDVALCPNPDRYISWDGIHFTQKAYKFITGWFLHHIYPHLRCAV